MIDKAATVEAINEIIEAYGTNVTIRSIDATNLEKTIGALTTASKTFMDGSKLAGGSSVVTTSMVCWVKGNLRRKPSIGDWLEVRRNSSQHTPQRYAITEVREINPDNSRNPYAYGLMISKG